MGKDKTVTPKGEVRELKNKLSECVDLIEFQPMELSQRGELLIEECKVLLNN